MPIATAHYKARQKFSETHPILKEFYRIFMILAGAAMVAFGLEFFLVPNQVLDGGVTGVSIMVAHIMGVPLGIVLAVLNFPFIILTWKFSGWRSALRTAIGIAALSGFTILFHHKPPMTDEYVLALGYGGILLGIGVGLALRYGGALDGVESVAHILSTRTPFDVDKIILIANFVIFSVAAFIYTPEQALGSFLMFYIVVAPLIKKVVDSGAEIKSIQIISIKHTEIAEMIHEKFNRKVIFTDAHKDDLSDDLKIVTVFVPRMEEAMLTNWVEEIDDKAIVIVHDASIVRSSSLTGTSSH